MITTNKLIVIGIVFSLFILSVFLIANPQISKAQYQYPYPVICSSNFMQKCVGNSIFWFDSCGNQQTWIKDCFNGCQDGYCINYLPPPYVKYYQKTCTNNNLYWHDSNGAIGDLYKNCSDNNKCTNDSCSGGQCLNNLKCDGSTCQKESSDYCSSCNYTGDGVCNCGENPENSPNDCKKQLVPAAPAVPVSGGLNVSIFCGVMDNSINLSKNVILTADQMVDCLVIVKNTSINSIENVMARADIPEEIISTEELKIDGVSLAGNITSGVDIGNFLPNMSKIITFNGKTQSLINQVSTKQITGIVSSGAISVFDSLTINFQPAGAIALSATSSVDSSSFVKFLKRWYVWILLAIVLIFLFFVIFKRISSNV
ncbi:MAG: hypothetical protein HY005_02090 [Candidatus Staskawiczbacteria bacterium]|nr:hypothetical protein [Candidatus Staskawiczbacteria bacterium]